MGQLSDWISQIFFFFYKTGIQQWDSRTMVLEGMATVKKLWDI